MRYILKKTAHICSQYSIVFSIIGLLLAAFIVIVIIIATLKRANEEWRKLNTRISNLEIFGTVIMGVGIVDVVYHVLRRMRVFLEIHYIDLWQLIDVYGPVIFMFGWFLKWKGRQRFIEKLIEEMFLEFLGERVREERDSFIRAELLFRLHNTSNDTMRREVSSEIDNYLLRRLGELRRSLLSVFDVTQRYFVKSEKHISTWLKETWTHKRANPLPITTPKSSERDESAIEQDFSPLEYENPETSVDNLRQEVDNLECRVNQMLENAHCPKFKGWRLNALFKMSQYRTRVIKESKNNDNDINSIRVEQGDDPNSIRDIPTITIPTITLPLPYTTTEETYSEPFRNYENEAEIQYVGSIAFNPETEHDLERLCCEQIIDSIVEELTKYTNYIIAYAPNFSLKSPDNEALFVGKRITNRRTQEKELIYVALLFNMHDETYISSISVSKGLFPDPESSLRNTEHWQFDHDNIGSLRAREIANYDYDVDRQTFRSAFSASHIIAGPQTGDYKVGTSIIDGRVVERPVFCKVASFSSEAQVERDGLATEIFDRIREFFNKDGSPQIEERLNRRRADSDDPFEE